MFLLVKDRLACDTQLLMHTEQTVEYERLQKAAKGERLHMKT